MADRRLFLTFLLLGLLGPALPALAKDGESGGKGDSGGGDNSGKGDNDRDDNDRDDDKDDDKDDRDEDREDDKKKDEKKDDDDEKIRKAVARGDAEPLKAILKALRQRYKGKVVNIKLTGEGRNLQYRIRLIDMDDRLIEVRVNARTARIVGSR